MQPMTRRTVLKGFAGAAALSAVGPRAFSAQPSGKRMGTSAACFGQRGRSSGKNGAPAPFRDALEMLEHCRGHGGGGVQTGVRGWSDGFAERVRAYCEAHGMYFEGQLALPRDGADAARFEADVKAAKAAGATVVRCACLSGRRYETFEKPQDFDAFRGRAWRSVELAEPIVRRQRVRLALENHKDWRVPGMLELLEHVGSEYVGVCVDTGNSIALLEDPVYVVASYAPHAFACHLKDMAVREYEDGFLLWEVVFGDGFLDLAAMVKTLSSANPAIQFSLEMITRDPLAVPCLTGKYWATMADVPGRALADTLTLVRKHASAKPPPRVGGLSADERAAAEESNIKACFAYAHDRLQL